MGPHRGSEGLGLVKIAVFVIENVLAHGDDLRQVTATKLAKPLYDAVRSQFNTIALTKADEEIARWWLKRERLHNWGLVSAWPQDLLGFNQWRIDQVRFFLSDGWEIGLYFDSEDMVLAHVSELGVATMKMSYPAKAVGWKDPEMSAPRSWEVLAATVEGTHQEADDGTG